ncbi:MAG: SDR family oxidoreductase [Acidimicrobiales bacterium]
MNAHVDLTDTTALVTGSSRGLGRATALALARNGADVVVTYRSKDAEAQEVADEIRGLGRKAWVHQLDMEDVDSIDALFALVAADVGHLDLLVLNAAATSFKPLLEAEPRHLERTYAISVVGFLRAVQKAVPLLEPRGGTIIGISGADTRTYIPAHGILAGAKAAMEAMIRYLACELGPLGITILGVNPGTIMGDSIRLMIGDDLYDAAERFDARSHPLRSAATPDDIAEPIVLLASPLSRWMHGTIIDADGGSIHAMTGRWMDEGTRATLNELGLDADAAGPSATVD